MSEPLKKCSACKNEIPVGKYFELHGKQLDTFYKIGDYCSPCWTKEETRYEIEIKNGRLKVIEAERERERAKSVWKVWQEPPKW